MQQHSYWVIFLVAILGFGSASAVTYPTDSYVNFETPQVTPMDISPSGNTLAVCNTPDNRIEIFDLSNGVPEWEASVPVGIDPVSVRFLSDTTVWVVNHISDSVSIVNLTTLNVERTLSTLDEPTDVVFAGSPLRAFVSCSQADTILVYNVSDLGQPPTELFVMGEDPRAMAVSPDGNTVYVAIFESGNKTTILGGGSGDANVISFPPNIVSSGGTPHSGQNPPFNGTGAFIPPKEPANGIPPRVGLIVKQDEIGSWRDDTGADWSQWIDGVSASASGRVPGWTLLDNDVMVIDANSLDVSYIEGMMNICMALAVNPASGEVSVVGTDAINEVRFEPVINGIFGRVMMAFGTSNPSNSVTLITDLNAGHLDYSVRTLPQAERQKSVGDPRGIVWNSAGTRAYITGMGSNNVIVVDNNGDRDGLGDTIPVGEGPTGLVLDEVRGQLYVLNRFSATLSIVDTNTELEIGTLDFFDPTPEKIATGRKHLYDTHKNSGLGQVSCATCHVDSRMDRLAWDLGDPEGFVDLLSNRTLNFNAGVQIFDLLGNDFSNFHPMKGPMTTQTLQDIIGHEPLHWRGDRFGLEEFNGAFIGLQANDTNLTSTEMQEFKDFLSTIHFPPNPYRNLDNSLPTNLPLDGHYHPGKFGVPAGTPLPNGNAIAGLALFTSQSRPLDRDFVSCLNCHAIPTGAGTNFTFNQSTGKMEPIPPGPMGEKHLMMVSVDGSTQTTIKVPHLRNLYDKVGFEMTNAGGTNISRAGFGFLHDGSVDSLARFVAEEAFTLQSTQEIADMVALMLAWSGSDFPFTPSGTTTQPPGEPSRDAHAAVGRQVTITSPGDDLAALNTLLSIVNNSNRVEMIVKGVINGSPRGGMLITADLFQLDQVGQTAKLSDLVAQTASGAELTFTVVPNGLGYRMGIDRDNDGALDYDEVLAGTDPADPDDHPGGGGEGEGEGGGEGEGEGEGEPIDCDTLEFPNIDDRIKEFAGNPLFEQLNINIDLHPSAMDINGGLDINIFNFTFTVHPKNMVDSAEFHVIDHVLANPFYDAPGGAEHTATFDAYQHNLTRMRQDLGPIAPQLLPGVVDLFAHMVTAGDDGGWDFVFTLMQLIDNFGAFLLGFDPQVTTPNRGNYIILPAWFSPDGDADGDGFTNRQEYDFFFNRGNVPYTVHLDADPGVILAEEPPFYVAAGGYQDISFSLQQGYRLTDVIVDGMSRGPIFNVMVMKNRLDYLRAAIDPNITPSNPGVLLTEHTVEIKTERCVEPVFLLASVSPASADIAGGAQVLLSGNFDVPYDFESLDVFFTNSLGVKDPINDSTGQIVSVSGTEIWVSTPQRGAAGDFNVYIGADQGLDFITSNMRPFVFTDDAGGEGEGEGEGGGSNKHSADTNGDNSINLVELLRVIQFFNLLALHCDDTTEDGYAPGAGDTACTHHSSDYKPADWNINLQELLRIIQIFNVGGYEACVDGVEGDGFCLLLP